MALLISCQTVAILVCIFAATAIGREIIGKEKRSELPEGLLAALGGIPKSGPAVRARSLTKETRSVSNEGEASSSSNNGYNPDCVISGSNGVDGSRTSGGYSWEFGENRVPDWRGEAVMMSSGVTSSYSSWTMACAQILALVQFIFVLVSMA